MELTATYFNIFGDSQKPMAASIQSLEYCEAVIDYAGLSSILDAGSGLSSAFFHSRYGNVVTVDDDQYWAGRTRQFLLSEFGRDVTIGQIGELQDARFDFVFYDYGNIETRIFYFKKALSACRRCMYVDDMHVGYYRDYVMTKARNYSIELVDASKDEFGRYGALIIK
ncbi:MAG: hypothetical protein ACTHLD_12130 [Chitinophaga sp.]|jgi:hypothetical protein